MADEIVKKEMQNETKDAQDVLDHVNGFEIKGQEDLEFAAELLADAKGHWNRLEEKRKKITQPMREALNEVQALFKPALNFYAECEVLLKTKIAEAHREAQAEQDRALAAAQTAHEQGDRAGTAAALAKAQTSELENPKGVSTRDVWKWRITHILSVPRQYLIIDQAKINKIVKERKGDTQIPGIEVYKETSVASRSN